MEKEGFFFYLGFGCLCFKVCYDGMQSDSDVEHLYIKGEGIRSLLNMKIIYKKIVPLSSNTTLMIVLYRQIEGLW